MAISCAAAVDPRGLALAAYYRRLPEENEDEETRQAIHRRSEIYNLLVDVLAHLHKLSGADDNYPPSYSSESTLSPAAAELERNRVVDFILENNDELCHVYLFRFLIDKQLEGLLINKSNMLFERFICR